MEIRWNKFHYRGVEKIASSVYAQGTGWKLDSFMQKLEYLRKSVTNQK